MAAIYKRNTLELTLEGVQCPEPWDARQKKPVERLVTATLVWPRPLVAERVAARTFRFEGVGLNLDGRDWSERILFKENVEGPFGLVVQISSSLSTHAAQKLAASLGAGLLRAAGSEAAGIAVGPGLTSLARFPFTFLAGVIGDAVKTPSVTAAGRLTQEPGGDGVLEVPLVFQKDVAHVKRTRRAGRVQARREVIHRQGEPAGTVLLRAAYYRG